MAPLSLRTASHVAPAAGWPFAWVLHGPWPQLSSGGRSLHLGCMEVSRLVCLCVLWCASVKPGHGLPPMWTEQCPFVPCLRFVSRKVPVAVGQQRGAWIPADHPCHLETHKAVGHGSSFSWGTAGLSETLLLGCFPRRVKYLSTALPQPRKLVAAGRHFRHFMSFGPLTLDFKQASCNFILLLELN